MPKPIVWRDEWSLNIDALDSDHRALVEGLGEICLRFCPQASHAAGAGANDLLDALGVLGEQMREHFRREEAFMREIGYEGLGEQKNEHAMLMAEYAAMLREWKKTGVSVLDDSIQESVRHWLLSHILGGDTRFATSYFQLLGLDTARPR